MSPTFLWELCALLDNVIQDLPTVDSSTKEWMSRLRQEAWEWYLKE